MPRLIPAALAAGMTTLITGGLNDNPVFNLDHMFLAFEGMPVNLGILGRAASYTAAPLERQIDRRQPGRASAVAGAIGAQRLAVGVGVLAVGIAFAVACDRAVDVAAIKHLGDAGRAERLAGLDRRGVAAHGQRKILAVATAHAEGRAGSGGPLVGIRLHVLTRKTLGGLETDLAGRALRPDGSALAGVYAVGEAAGFGGGGAHGYRALEGTFLGGCLFTGRTAGRALAASL